MKLVRIAKYHPQWHEDIERSYQIAYDKLVLNLSTVELVKKYGIAPTRIKQISDKYKYIDDGDGSNKTSG